MPNWQSFGGCNDRFAITKNYNAALAYASRLDDAINFCDVNKEPLHSERLVDFTLRKNRVKTVGIPITFSRVRNNGEVVKEKFKNNLWKAKVRHSAKKIFGIKSTPFSSIQGP